MLSGLVPARSDVCRACPVARLWPRSTQAHCRGDVRILCNSSGRAKVPVPYLPRRPRADHGVLDGHPFATSGGVGVRIWTGETSFPTGPFSRDLVCSFLPPSLTVDGFNCGRRLVRYLGCFTAYGLFIWRYLNVPRNWEYVGSFWSIAIIVVTRIPETVYPFLYTHTHTHNLLTPGG
jgi:hypothetical protein